MLKNERHQYILDELNKNDAITVSDIVEKLEVSDMTIRRDLSELEDSGALKRVHGGAILIGQKENLELSHKEKKILNINEKKHIAMIARTLIGEEDTIFLGPGTTIEIFAEAIESHQGLIVTNCLPVFHSLNRRDFNVILLGGEMRKITEAFNGDLTINMLRKLKFDKAFFSCNGVVENEAMTATISEGNVQALALNNSKERYLLLDTSKIGREDFYSYYDIRDITAVITYQDKEEKFTKLSQYTKVITE